MSMTLVQVSAQCPHCDVKKHQIDGDEHRAMQIVGDAIDRHIREAHGRPRVSFTPGSIQGVVTARKRHVCQNHLDSERHYIEPGDRYVANALPPDPDIGNPGWWHLRVCLDCCPIEHDERRQATPEGDQP